MILFTKCPQTENTWILDQIHMDQIEYSLVILVSCRQMISAMRGPNTAAREGFRDRSPFTFQLSTVSGIAQYSTLKKKLQKKPTAA